MNNFAQRVSHSCSDKKVKVDTVEFDNEENKLHLGLSADQACLRGELTVTLTDNENKRRTYNVTNGGEVQILRDDIQCSPCKMIVGLKSDSQWNLEGSDETEQWFGSSESYWLN